MMTMMTTTNNKHGGDDGNGDKGNDKGNDNNVKGMGVSGSKSKQG